MAVVAVRISGFDPCGGSSRTTIQQPLDIGAVLRSVWMLIGLKNRRRSFLPPGCDLLSKSGGDCSGERNRKRMLADRRDRYGDPKSPCGFWPTWCFGSIVSPATGKGPDQPLGVGLLTPAPESGDKLTRFGPFSSQCVPAM
jgi:hypothetical protein